MLSQDRLLLAIRTASASLITAACMSCSSTSQKGGDSTVSADSAAKLDLSYRGWAKVVADTASLEIAGINFRLGTATDSALRALPAGITKRFDARNNAYDISSNGNSLGMLYIKEGRVYAVRKYSDAGKPSEMFKFYREVERRGGSVCLSKASEFTPDDAPDDRFTLYDFKTECGPVYSFALRTDKTGNWWVAYLQLALPEE
jgi:hypothetical protein